MTAAPGPAPPLRVAVDATPLLGRRTGVGVFTAELLAQLGGRADVDAIAFPVSLRGHGGLADVVPPGVAVTNPRLPAAVMHATWRRFARPRIDRFVGRPDVVHGPNFVVPPARAARVVTVHDLTPLRFPELCHPATLAFPDLVRRAAADGAWVHADSAAVRDELLAELDLPPERVVSVPLGVTPRTGGDAARGRSLAGFDRFVLAVGTVEPRKDLPSLVRAVDELAAAGEEVPLVHVGPDGWGSEALDRAVGGMRRPDLVTRFGPASDADLCDLLAAARLMAYPSVYEGFGLPVLEAMLAGVPVVSTTVPAIEEVAGGAARLVPVGDVAALTSAIGDVWSDETQRQRMVAAGRRRAEQFSWRACADGLVGLYRRAADAEAG